MTKIYSYWHINIDHHEGAFFLHFLEFLNIYQFYSWMTTKLSQHISSHNKETWIYLCRYILHIKSLLFISYIHLIITFSLIFLNISKVLINWKIERLLISINCENHECRMTTSAIFFMSRGKTLVSALFKFSKIE